MTVKDFMSANVYFVKEKACVSDVVNLMRQHDIGFVPVCTENGELTGIVTDRDLLLRSFSKETSSLPHLSVTSIMTTNVCVISADMDIHEAGLVFSQKRVHRLPVVKGSTLIGVLSVSDLAKKRVLLSDVGDIIHAITLEKNIYVN